MMTDSLHSLEKTMGYTFKDPDLLEMALSHRSYDPKNNERLEFLGDAILNFVIAGFLYAKFPSASEGQLSRLRATLVKGETLATIALDLDLGEYLRLGPGELRTGGTQRRSILADALEALIGAIYLEAEMPICQQCILNWFAPRLATISLSESDKDPKTCLQEVMQSRQLALPIYTILSIQGKSHDLTFHVQCAIEGLPHKTEGKGTSRRKAEQRAAKAYLALLEQIDE